METYHLKNDIRLLCVKATSYPEGIEGAHEKLQGLLSSSDKRNFFGISHPLQDGKIMYMAGAEEAFAGESDQLKLETFVVKKGEYKGARIINYPDHIDSIGKTFEKILKDPRIDPEGCCVEVYLNEKDVQCMIRLES